MTSKSSKRVGSKMVQVVSHVGEKRIDVARRVGPNGSLKYGYAIIARALAAGLVTLYWLPGERGARIGSV